MVDGRRGGRGDRLGTFGQQPHRPAKGQVGEQAAVEHLLEQGYVILHRNVRTRCGEIDVIARDGEVLCFVEIKARATRQYGTGLEAVTADKQRRIARSAAMWLAKRGPIDRPCRFDVVALDRRPSGGWEVRLVRAAFST